MAVLVTYTQEFGINIRCVTHLDPLGSAPLAPCRKSSAVFFGRHAGFANTPVPIEGHMTLALSSCIDIFASRIHREAEAEWSS